MSTKFKLFLLAFALIASHFIDKTIMYGFDPYAALTLLPYILVGMFWTKLNDWMRTVLLLFFFFLERRSAHEA